MDKPISPDLVAYFHRGEYVPDEDAQRRWEALKPKLREAARKAAENRRGAAPVGSLSRPTRAGRESRCSFCDEMIAVADWIVKTSDGWAHAVHTGREVPSSRRVP